MKSAGTGRVAGCWIAALFLANTPCLAAPYPPDGLPVTWTQPDGAPLKLRVFGDEFHARTETAEGYTVVFDPASKAYQYARLSADDTALLPTGVAVGKGDPLTLGIARHLSIDPATARAEALARFRAWDTATGNSQRWSGLKAQRRAFAEAVEAAADGGGPMPAPPSFTTLGNKVGLTLLIDFSDDPATIPQASVVDFCNGHNYTGYGNNGSVKKYFQDNSNGLLTYTNTVTAYIRMARPKTYYDDTTVDCGLQGRLLINDAIDIMKALPNYNTEILPTFGDLTVDGSNRIAACNVFFAGANSGVWSFGLWPHSWSLASDKELSPGGKKVRKYQITNLGSSLTLGTFCHENGHMLCGYPDIYDYDYDSKGGAGNFCLMNSGGHGTNPVLICAYLRYASGWTVPTELDVTSSLTGSLVASPGNPGFNNIYRYARPGTPTEYFLFENRRKTGRDANISASGIAIWHIDELGDHNDQSLLPNTTHSNYECSLEQADNLWHFQSNTNAGDSRDLHYLGNAAAAYTNIFNDSSAPNSNWWDGSPSGLAAFNFSSAGATMTLDFGLPADTIRVLSPDGGESLSTGGTVTITWAANLAGNVRIELLKGGLLESVLSPDEANDGSFDWAVSTGLAAAGNYRIRIRSIDQPSVEDSSDADFALKQEIFPPSGTLPAGWVTPAGATKGWEVASDAASEGVLSLRNIDIGDSQTAAIESTGQFEAGTVSFDVKVSTESGWDFLRFYIDGNERLKLSGSIDWQSHSFAVAAGTHTFKWEYTKDGSVSSNDDTVWIDAVVLPPDSSITVAFSSDTFSVDEDAGTATITIDRNGGDSGAVSVQYATSDGSATAGGDYTAATGTLNWADGDSASKTFTIPITDDSSHEAPQETLSITLSNPVGGIITGTNPATLVIREDDNQPPTVSAGPNQFVILGGTAWSPDLLSPALWLDADDAATITLNGATVSQWADKSGNSRHATQGSATNQPTSTGAGINGRNVLTFDGSSDYLNVNLDFMAGVDHSTFIVTKTTNYTDIYGAANGNSGANSLHVGFRNATSYRMNYWANDWYGTLSANFQAGSANLLNYTWISGATKQILANGKSEGTNSSAGVIGTMSGGGRISNVVGHGYYGGDIAEFIAFNAPLALADRQALEGFLAHKWGTAGLLAADHPYKTEGPNSLSSTANLAGTSDDGDLDPLTLGWSLVDGPAAVTFADPGAVPTTATFTMAGAYTLRLTADDGYGEVSSDVIVTVLAQGPYDGWTETRGLTGPDADPAADLEPGGGDGMTNLLEFAYGTDPQVADLAPLQWAGTGNPVSPGAPVLLADTSGGGLAYKARFIRRKDHGTPGSILYRWEISADASTWESSADAPSWLTAPIPLADDPSGEYELVEIPFPLLPDSLGRGGFFRLTVELP